MKLNNAKMFFKEFENDKNFVTNIEPWESIQTQQEIESFGYKMDWNNCQVIFH